MYRFSDVAFDNDDNFKKLIEVLITQAYNSTSAPARIAKLKADLNYTDEDLVTYDPWEHPTKNIFVWNDGSYISHYLPSGADSRLYRIGYYHYDGELNCDILRLKLRLNGNQKQLYGTKPTNQLTPPDMHPLHDWVMFYDAQDSIAYPIPSVWIYYLSQNESNRGNQQAIKLFTNLATLTSGVGILAKGATGWRMVLGISEVTSGVAGLGTQVFETELIAVLGPEGYTNLQTVIGVVDVAGLSISAGPVIYSKSKKLLTLLEDGAVAAKVANASQDVRVFLERLRGRLRVIVYGVGNSLSFINGWTKQSIIAKVSELKAVGQKLNPTQYLSPTYITNHLNKFKTKASYLVTGDTYDNFILGKATVGRSDGLFISTADDIDAVIAKAHGNVSIIEQELGIPAGSWQGKGGIVRIDINNPENFNLRIPDGSEAGANALWEPGGLTSGGKVEAVTNPIPTTNINASKIIQ
jgi:hypothetical protein